MNTKTNVKIQDAHGAWPFPFLKAAWDESSEDWIEVTKANAEYAGNVLPPKYFQGGFLMGEAYTDDSRGVTVYAAVAQVGGRYFMRYVAQDRAAEAVTALREAVARDAAARTDVALYGVPVSSLDEDVRQARERGVDPGSLAVSILSDAQEELNGSSSERARQLINRAKYVIEHALPKA